MRIQTAEFVRAARRREDYPAGGRAEIAFAGRSNVGKSSMINVLLGRRNLVKTSRTPGHTRALNFFLINADFVFVDFPGYGYARVPLEEKERWRPMVETYLTQRNELAGVVVITDARRPPTDSDRTLISFLQAQAIPYILAATKADKLTRREAAARLRAFAEEIDEGAPVVFFSALDGQGKNDLWKEIKSLIDLGRSRLREGLPKDRGARPHPVKR
jgi:GTP-binding protein